MKQRYLSWILATIVLVTLLGARPGRVRAAVYAVNSSWDGAGSGDADLDDDICRDSNGFCTLRAAIEQANARIGIDAITFATPMTITIDTGTGALPAITDQVTIDASGEAAAGRPGVTIDGDDGSFSGLSIQADACEIYGLHITGFGDYGIQIQSASNQIGSPDPDQRNVVSNNNGGILLMHSSAYSNTIQNNWIGVGLDGQTAAPNTIGIVVTNGAYANLIGGHVAGTGNYISGNYLHGVLIMMDSDFNQLGDNVIGLTPVNDQPMGNGGSGVFVQGGSDAVDIGTGTTSVPLQPNTITVSSGHGVFLKDVVSGTVSTNTIAGNVGDGVRIEGASALGNHVFQNSIRYNGGKGIELINGGNAELAVPIITAASATGVSGTACAGCIINLYSDYEDEGYTHEALTVAGGNGDWSYTGPLTGPYVTATSTDANNTSEFSAPRALGVCGGPIPLTCGQQVSGDTTGYPNNCQDYDCSAWAAPESGPETIYSLNLPTVGTWAFTATLSNMSADLDVFVLSSSGCSTGGCLTAGSYGNNMVEVDNVSGGPYYIAVEGYNGAAGSYTLDLTCNVNRVYLPLVLRNH